MRKLIVLPGNSLKNKVWGEGIITHFGNLFDEVYMQSYRHWETGAETMDFEYEAERLGKVLEGNETEQYIFAKSFGSILSFLAIHRGILVPKKCIFFGIPLNLVEQQNIWNGEWIPIETFTLPALAFHNENDPVANYTFTTQMLSQKNVDSIRIIPTPDDNHTYDNFAIYEPYIKDFLRA